MKIVVAAVLFALAASSIATGSDDAKLQYCIEIGGLFVTFAQYRDMGVSPQSAFGAWHPSMDGPTKIITEKQVKKIINTVYFDPGFTYAGGQALQMQMIDSCLRGWKPRNQPLK